MKHRKLTVTIGIPAFNEETNIATLLKSLLNQVSEYVVMKNILVYSDASVDGTEQAVQSLQSDKIEFVKSKKRMGKPAISNYIFHHADTDIVVILDADIRLTDNAFIEELTLPIVEGRADLTSGKITELPPVTFIEKVLAASMDIKRESFESYNNGQNIYTCHGRSRAFSRRFYTKFVAPVEVAADDAYSYIECLKLGFAYSYTPKAVLQYRLPKTVNDHLRQSRRFFQGNQRLLEYVDPNVVNELLSLPTSLKVKALVKFMITQPIYFACYIGILFYSKLQSVTTPSTTSKWSIATSSKALD